MPTITTSDFKKGVALLWKNEPYIITDFQKVNPGKGTAFTRTKIKNCQTGKVLEITFKSGEQVETADLQRKKPNIFMKNRIITISWNMILMNK